jgi:hypothetical protein
MMKNRPDASGRYNCWLRIQARPSKRVVDMRYRSACKLRIDPKMPPSIVRLPPE